MGLIRFINKKMTYSSIKNLLRSYLFFGTPIVYITVQILKIISFGWQKYTFRFDSLLFLVFFDMLMAMPFIIIYFKEEKKLSKLIQRTNEKYSDFEIGDTIKLDISVKCIYDYKTFKKGEIYLIFPLHLIFDSNTYYDITKIINKFNIDNLKEERLKKLKKLKRSII